MPDPKVTPGTDESLGPFAARLVAGRLEVVDRQLARAREDQSPDAVHDLRVAARRLLCAIDWIGGNLHTTDVRRLRKRVKAILRAGRRVRDRDIALELAVAAGLDGGSALIRTLERQRDEAEEVLRSKVERRRYREFAAKWAGEMAR